MGVPFLDALSNPQQNFNDFINEQAQKFGLPPEVILGIRRGTASVPSTRTRLSHAYTLRTAQNRVIGAVFRTEVGQNRNIETEWEVDPNAVGEPADLVPQQMTEQSFALARWDLYDEVLEDVFFNDELGVLTEQRRGFRLRESWRASGARGRLYEYGPCWFEHLGRTVESTGDRTVRVNARLKWLRRTKVVG